VLAKQPRKETRIVVTHLIADGLDALATAREQALGRFDAQTLRGKTPMGVARVAKRHGVPVVVLAGTLGEGYQQLYAHGVDAAFALASGPMSLEQACANAAELLQARACDIGRLWRSATQGHA